MVAVVSERTNAARKRARVVPQDTTPAFVGVVVVVVVVAVAHSRHQ